MTAGPSVHEAHLIGLDLLPEPLNRAGELDAAALEDVAAPRYAAAEAQVSIAIALHLLSEVDFADVAVLLDPGGRTLSQDGAAIHRDEFGTEMALG